MELRKTPVSDHLCEIVRPWVEELEPDQDSYERAFDRWEYLLGLAMFDLTRAAGRGYAPVGRLSWRGDYGGGIEIALAAEIEAAGSDWPLLRGGLFGRAPARLGESVQGWNEHIGRVRGNRF